MANDHDADQVRRIRDAIERGLAKGRGEYPQPMPAATIRRLMARPDREPVGAARRVVWGGPDDGGPIGDREWRLSPFDPAARLRYVSTTTFMQMRARGDDERAP